MMSDQIMDRLAEQVDLAQAELSRYEPVSVDWHQRCLTAVRLLVPWLLDTAPKLQFEIDLLLSSPSRVREAWNTVKGEVAIPLQLIAELDTALELESVLVQQASGALISKIIESFLIANYPGGVLKSNGSSDYPDLYLSDLDYSFLSPHTRTADTYAASLKAGRPVRVPDGIEIKTIVGSGGIDCHFPHVGLHLIVILKANHEAKAMHVTDVRLGFARLASYRITTPRTKATTLKASFNSSTVRSAEFPSLLMDA